MYGNGARTELLDEDALLPLPDHFYTATKLAGEMYCRAYGSSTASSRRSSASGSRTGPARARRGRRDVRGARARRLALRIMGDGTQARQFVYVEDLAEGVVSALVPHAAGRTYNLVGDEAVSVREVADIVRRLVSDVPIVARAEPACRPASRRDLGRARPGASSAGSR